MLFNVSVVQMVPFELTATFIGMFDVTFFVEIIPVVCSIWQNIQFKNEIKLHSSRRYDFHLAHDVVPAVSDVKLPNGVENN